MWLSVPPGFYDSAIAELSQNQANAAIFARARKFHICRRFWASTRPLTSSQSAFSQRKVVYQFKKFNEHLYSHHARFTRATLDKLTESGTNPCYSFDLLGLLCHATPLYTALGDTVKKSNSPRNQNISVRSCEKNSNWWRILKLRISEQTPLMWKPGETLLSKQLHLHHGFNITTGTTCGLNRLMFSSDFKCFTQLFSARRL